MSSGVAIFQSAEELYARGDIQGAFDLYQTAEPLTGLSP
jgi:hypothetical protein